MAAPEIRVVMVGPALTVRGGVSTVARRIIQAERPPLRFRHVATHQDGPKAVKALRFARGLAHLCWLLAFWRPLIVHVHFAEKASTTRKLICMRLARLAGAAVVSHAHAGHFDSYYLAQTRTRQSSIARGLGIAQRMIVLGSIWVDFFERHCHYPRTRMVVLPNPVLMPAETKRQAHDGFRILFVGRVVAAKGIYEAIDAVAGLSGPLRSVTTLVVCGDGELERVRARCAEQRVNLELHGWVSEAQLSELYATADVLALPSQFEGMPMAVLEAMSHGLPVLATPVGTIPDIVIAGETGLFLDPADVSGSLSRQIAELSTDRVTLQRMSARSLVHARQFDIEPYLTRLLAVYEDAHRDR